MRAEEEDRRKADLHRRLEDARRAGEIEGGYGKLGSVRPVRLKKGAKTASDMIIEERNEGY